MRLLMPNGEPAKSIDRIMLMAMWVKFLNEEKSRHKPPIIAAGMGKPTFAINSKAVQASLDYWANILAKNRKVQTLIETDENLTEDTLNSIAEAGAAIDYDSPQGNSTARKLLAQAATEWYETKITNKDVLLTVGGASGIYACFQVLKNRFPDSYIATPVPYYSLYEKAPNKLHLINVMRNSGYQFTAQTLKESLEEAKKLNRPICAILICDPNNPLSTIISPAEWEYIANILRLHPNILIVLDEAYAEMQLDGRKYISLLTVAPDLKKRILIFRSATKGLSAAGERMAATFIFDHEIMQEMMDTTVNIYGHAPVSSQIVYATAFSSLTSKTMAISARYHKRQVDYVFQTLVSMGAEMPDPQYKPMGTFYVLSHLSELYDQPIFREAIRALGKNGKTITDEDIAYNLLFQDGVMIAPLSYFGASNKAGFFRITCSEGLEKLRVLMQRLAIRLTIAREISQGKLLTCLMLKLETLKIKRPEMAIQILIEIEDVTNSAKKTDIFLNAKQLQTVNQSLKLLLQKVEQKLALCIHHVSLLGGEGEKKAELAYCPKWADKILLIFEQEAFNNWYRCIGHHFTEEEARTKFFGLPSEEKLNFVPWKMYIMMQLQLHRQEMPTIVTESQSTRPLLTSRL